MEEEEKLKKQRVKILQLQLENERLKEKERLRKQLESGLTVNDSYVSRISLNNNSLIQNFDEKDRLENYDPRFNAVEERSRIPSISYDHNADISGIYTHQAPLPPTPNSKSRINMKKKRSRTPLRTKSRNTIKKRSNASKTPVKDSFKFMRLSLGLKQKMDKKEIKNIAKKNFERLPENVERKKQLEKEEEAKRRLRRKKMYSQVSFFFFAKKLF